jgi:hypothetical protein
LLQLTLQGLKGYAEVVVEEKELVSHLQSLKRAWVIGLHKEVVQKAPSYIDAECWHL